MPLTTDVIQRNRFSRRRSPGIISKITTRPQAIQAAVPPTALRYLKNPWSWATVNAGHEVLDPVFPQFKHIRGMNPGTMRKTKYHQLARLIPDHAIQAEVRQAEVRQVRDQIGEVASRTCPGR